jgi:glycosyltransferase involved in cell wall biosynthesis
MIATLITGEPLTRTPRILDVDDAIFAHRRGLSAGLIAKRCAQVICGNDYLADWFSRWCPNVVVIPTAVDTKRFRPADVPPPPDKFVIGWFGLSCGYRYLLEVEDALAAVLEAVPEASVKIVSDQPPVFSRLPRNRVNFMRWTDDNQADLIRSFSVGIMPLDNSEFAKGKCAYKMLLYMACGLPVVVSPVGMNARVLASGDVGYGAASKGDWVDSLKELASNRAMARRLGRRGREIVERDFSCPIIVRKLQTVIQSVV